MWGTFGACPTSALNVAACPLRARFGGVIPRIYGDETPR
jgi:hypothetical protein